MDHIHLCVAYFTRPSLFSRETSRIKICYHNGCISCAVCAIQSKKLSTIAKCFSVKDFIIRENAGYKQRRNTHFFEYDSKTFLL